MSRELLDLISLENESVAKHLDDTLLDRLETALYCRDQSHKKFWDDFNCTSFKEFMDHFDQELADDSLSIGKLKIKCAVLYQMKDHCTKQDFNRLKRALKMLIQSEDRKLISSLQNFYEKNLTMNFSFNIYLEDNNKLLLTLRELYKTSENLNHCQSSILFFILLLRAGIEHGDSFDEFCTYPRTPDEKTTDFLLDLVAEITRTSNQADDKTLYIYLTKLSEDVLEYYNENREEIQGDNDFMLFMMALSPYNIDIRPEFFDPTSPSIGSDLRTLISSKMFLPCPVHMQLAKWWFDAVLKFNRDSEVGSNSVLSSLSSCPDNYIKLSHFVSEMPPGFIHHLWQNATDSVYNKSFDRAFQCYWELFSKFCILLPEKDKKKYFFWLFDIIIASPKIIGEHSEVLDTFHTLYSNIHSFDMHEQSRVFERVYHLAKDECSNLVSSGGNLSFSYLLMRIYGSHVANKAVFMHLLEMQKSVAEKLIECPDLAIKKSVRDMHGGYFLAPLLELQSCAMFSLLFCEGITRLIGRLDHLKTKLFEEYAFPGTLKGVLLGCLFRCLEYPHVSAQLRRHSGLGAVVRHCEELASGDWEEDQLICKRIVECWSSLVRVNVLFLSLRSCCSLPPHSS